ncbi:iron-containing alcohol dehydrogenase [Escherichia coli]
MRSGLGEQLRTASANAWAETSVRDGRQLASGRIAAGLTRSLAVKGIAMTLWPCPVGKPCITDVCAAVAQLRESGCDGVIAFGGGSVLDAAKAVALLVTNPDSTLAEMSETSVLQPRLPLIAIPTTAGTGSETTNVTVIIDAVSGRKQVLAHASLMPEVWRS